MPYPRGTTPDFLLELVDDDDPTQPADVDLTEMDNVYVTITSPAGYKITKSGDALHIMPQAVEVSLSQEESLRLDGSYVELMVNWTYGSGKRGGSEVGRELVDRQLLPEVVV